LEVFSSVDDDVGLFLLRLRAFDDVSVVCDDAINNS